MSALIKVCYSLRLILSTCYFVVDFALRSFFYAFIKEESLMFGFFKKKEMIKEVPLYAIGSGKTLFLGDVPDQTFAAGLLGDGVGFVFEGDTIYAPCDGDVIIVAETCHAVGLRAENGAEILIHVGMDTVNLNGKGLHSQVSPGQRVKQGDPLLRIEREFMEEQGIDLTTPIILTNAQDYILTKEKEDHRVDKEDCIMKIIKR